MANKGRVLVVDDSVVFRRLIAEATPDAALRAVDHAYLPGIPMYGIVFVVAFFSPLAAVLLTFAIAAFYLPSAALFDR